MNKPRTILGYCAVAAVSATLIACGVGATSDPTTTPTPTVTATTQPPTTRPTPSHSTAPPTTPATVAPPTSVAALRPISAEQRNANQTAQDYLDGQSFSRTGLIKQLEFEGYPKGVATTAVSGLRVNWNEQAAHTAANYLDGQSFSHKGLISQLEFDGFTPSQAAYGVKAAGL